PKAWAWIILAIVGTLVMLVGQASGAAVPDAAGHRYGLLPYGAMLISLVVISLHTLLARSNADRYPVLLVSAVQMTGSALTSLFLIGCFREPLLPAGALTPFIWGIIIYLALCVNVFSTWYWLLATTKVPAYQVTVFTYLEPLFVVLIVALLGYPPETGLGTWAGGLLILIGAWMVSRLGDLPPMDPMPDTVV
ncbi:MAG: DMT family transporter, partial [bacterium]